jgi:hypothetical protein
MHGLGVTALTAALLGVVRTRRRIVAAAERRRRGRRIRRL